MYTPVQGDFKRTRFIVLKGYPVKIYKKKSYGVFLV